MKNKNWMEIFNDLGKNTLRPAALKHIKGNKDLRSDIIQDTMLVLISNKDKFLAHPNQKAYALSVMKDLIKKHKNKRKKTKKTLKPPIIDYLLLDPSQIPIFKKNTVQSKDIIPGINTCER